MWYQGQGSLRVMIILTRNTDLYWYGTIWSCQLLQFKIPKLDWSKGDIPFYLSTVFWVYQRETKKDSWKCCIDLQLIYNWSIIYDYQISMTKISQNIESQKTGSCYVSGAMGRILFWIWGNGDVLRVACILLRDRSAFASVSNVSVPTYLPPRSKQTECGTNYLWM